MNPVAIFRASSTEGPGYFATYLERRSIDWRLVKLDAGDAVPRDARRFSGLVFMGGPMSVNDELPWIAPALELRRDMEPRVTALHLVANRIYDRWTEGLSRGS